MMKKVFMSAHSDSNRIRVDAERDAQVNNTFEGLSSQDSKEPKRRIGRPRKTKEEREKEHRNLVEQVKNFLGTDYVFRYNSLNERVEIRYGDEDWQMFGERELNNLLTLLHSNDVKITKEYLATYVNSAEISKPVNPILEYVQSLKPWNRKTDYIRKVFDYLLLEEGSDTDFLYNAFKLYYVCMVACGIDLDIVNQLILVLVGEKEGAGKTEFLLRFLPKPLYQYIHIAVQLSQRPNKDESLATAFNLLFLLDEILLNKQTFNKLKNMVGGAGANFVTERAAYAHFSEQRKVHVSFAATTNHIDFLPSDLGNRRILVLPIVGSKNYDDMPVDKAFAQAYYLATHPRSFSTKISQEMMAKLKEINIKYVEENICEAVLPIVLRRPNPGEDPQAVFGGEIIQWIIKEFGPNKEFTPKKVGAALRKMGIKSIHRNQGNLYFVVKLEKGELDKECKMLANQEVERQEEKSIEQELPF